MNESKIPYKIYLSEDEMPTTWYNLRADMKNKPAPLLNPGTLQPMTAQELEGVFCAELVQQELDNDTAYFPIPQEIRDFYKMYRPSPLVRAYCLEKKLDTPAKIYYKFEGNNTSGSHKLNSAIAQAYYAKAQGLLETVGPHQGRRPVHLIKVPDLLGDLKEGGVVVQLLADQLSAEHALQLLGGHGLAGAGVEKWGGFVLHVRTKVIPGCGHFVLGQVDLVRDFVLAHGHLTPFVILRDKVKRLCP